MSDNEQNPPSVLSSGLKGKSPASAKASAGEQIPNPNNQADDDQAAATEPSLTDDYKNQWLRAMADYQNLKKDHARDREEWVKYSNAGLLLELLPVVRHFKEAMKHVPADQASLEWVVGIQHIKKQFDEFLARLGVTEIATVGEQFDPQRHEAIGQQTVADRADGEILEEVQAGYALQGKVIEPAKVIVNQKED
ncbi:nucleotide exchange factor GrpE [Candidatus Falkowbacteria bacterium]|nr:nucleotide exchange factor GrpE [Candidatus Falkowbacteria bacterium]